MEKAGRQYTLEEIDCNLCGNTSHRPLVNVDGYTLVKCRRCGFVYVNPRIARSELPSKYVDTALKFHCQPERMRQVLSPAFLDAYERQIEPLERLVSKGRLLDLGCSTGAFMHFARQRGWEVFGVEIAEPSARYAAEVMGLPVFIGELSEAAIPDGSFDAATLWHVADYLDYPLQHLREVYRVLRPGGVVGVLVPNINSLSFRLLKGRWRRMIQPQEHLSYFSPRTLRTLLMKAGFEIVDLFTSSTDLYYIVKHWRAPEGGPVATDRGEQERFYASLRQRRVSWKLLRFLGKLFLTAFRMGDHIYAFARKPVKAGHPA